ncbi:tRNA (adenosine(37)-N6)-threonylcarbamoyltransferase complex ATPase subunit type 1 TsaE [Pseudoruegeria sp. HB172150]|uniref:tRNA (adenosine(37)-N6)-threonylcarbamoyltransferase complex ATPase subunit type 1 TsaE n=1 Tax=Pseudoruegeria sp. HB172150 TaxID=2721164 RepID=UPI0015579ACC|nr:tRNA (adenosine(37)-N6)-threonylcarbamoyltransferase complex ATPase subunit type 1 TsaE [Pseudoruegeria sp. HB172150]
MNASLTFQSPEETAAFAAALAPLLKPGDAILLQGGLGSGKTHFARSLIQARLSAAGLAEDVPSPTYTLVQVYDDGLSEIWHCDLYRLSGPHDVVELGLEEAFSSAICLIEWPDRLDDFAPRSALTLELSMTDAPGKRTSHFTSDSPRWRELMTRVLPDTVNG